MYLCASPFCGEPATKQAKKTIFDIINGESQSRSIEYELCNYHYMMMMEVWP